MLRRSRRSKASLALRLIEASPTRGSIVVSGATYGSNKDFLKGLRERGLPFVTELRASELMMRGPRKPRPASRSTLAEMLGSATWQLVVLVSPSTGNRIRFSVASIPHVGPAGEAGGVMFAVRTGRIEGIHRGTIFGFASGKAPLRDLANAVLWARWIRTALRRGERVDSVEVARANNSTSRVAAKITVRANIALAAQQDHQLKNNGERFTPTLRGVLGGKRRVLNVVELFAGAGGMGLGFLLAQAPKKYRVLFSGEVNPIYAATLRKNHEWLADTKANGRVPPATDPVDLRKKSVLAQIEKAVRRAGGVDVLIGGPPCQGFSNANRNSWSRANPNNKLVNVFMRYVEALSPPVFVMENVQGILWTSGARSASAAGVVDSLAARMRRAGYRVYPRLLDAAWYGVPQFRSRFFLVGIHRDLGYDVDDFGEWGPFPQPTHGPSVGGDYVDVRQALADLPALRNGDDAVERRYSEPSSNRLRRNPYLAFLRSDAPRGRVHDHVTSRHADYVIDRYRKIPQGGNWESIVDTMSNYADVRRTHSNIYRRLEWKKPAITIGHYRKSMLVHPEQHRGLSLREASRLQSFPDWFRFSGTPDDEPGGLVHKQQQLANAVCPLVSKALAEFLAQI